MQTVTQAIMQAAIEAARELVKAITETADPIEGIAERGATSNLGPKAGGPTLKQPTCNSTMKDKYDELKTLRWG